MKVKGLNDAKYTAITVYFTTIAILLSLITTFVLSKYINAFAIIYGLCTWATPTIVLGVLFIPKVYSIDIFYSYLQSNLNNNNYNADAKSL